MVCRGCLGKCSYCAIRRAIGSVRSKSICAVLEEFKNGLEDGFQDFVLLGDDLGAYGQDGPGNLPALMKALHEHIENVDRPKENIKEPRPIARFHLKEVYPKYLLYFEDSLPRLFIPRDVKSLLCPIQTGSPRILKLMQREHTIDDVIRLIEKIRNINPEIELSTQVIAGFPTETEADFKETLELVKKLRFDWAVIFPYDPKKGTPASALDGRIPEEIVRKRVREALKYFRANGVKAFTNCPW